MVAAAAATGEEGAAAASAALALPQQLQPLCPGKQNAGATPDPAEAAATGAAAANSVAAGILYFNWDQRTTARAAMATLVAALADDPVNTYFCGTRRRRRFVKDEVKGYLKALRSATHFIATPDSNAVALWQLLPAETPRNELWAGWTRILAVSPRLWAQLLRLELKYEEAHASAASCHGPFYYLSFIGTAPGCRGRGLGSRLLAEVTARADKEGRWCLLEATSEASEALYARHGFVSYEAYRVSSRAPPVFLMKRPPQAGSVSTTAAGAAAAAAAAAGAVNSSTAATTAAAPEVAVASPESAAAAGALAAAIAGKEASAAAAAAAAGGAGADDVQLLLLLSKQHDDAKLAAGLSLHALIVVGDAAGLADSDTETEEGSNHEEDEEETAAGDGVSGAMLLAAASGAASGPGAAAAAAAAEAAPADARVIIRSASSMLMQGKGGLCCAAADDDADAAAADSVAQASSQAGAPQPCCCDARCDSTSSSLEGAGGPSPGI